MSVYFNLNANNNQMEPALPNRFAAPSINPSINQAAPLTLPSSPMANQAMPRFRSLSAEQRNNNELPGRITNRVSPILELLREQHQPALN